MIIVDGDYGGLCNTLFSYANQLVFAKETGIKIISLPFSKYSEHFPFFSDRPFGQYPKAGYLFKTRFERKLMDSCYRLLALLIRKIYPSNWYYLGEQKLLKLGQSNDPTIQTLLKNKISVLTGFYFLAGEYFSKNSYWIRKVFTPSLTVQTKIKSLIDIARSSADIIVGIHMRQGDYQHFANGLYYYTVDEYLVIMRQFSHLVKGKKVIFIICSNENIDISNQDNLNSLSGFGDPILDLYTLSKCDFIIGPPSTFSQWASFYGQVPKYVLNYKCEDFYNVKRTRLDLDAFKTHENGYGKHTG